GRERARRDRTPEPFGDDSPAVRSGGARTESNPEALLAAQELPPPLVEALACLPEAQRQAVELLYLDQLPVSEAAARVGVTASALKVRAHGGSRALRRALRGQEWS